MVLHRQILSLVGAAVPPAAVPSVDSSLAAICSAMN
jgi:hypothetical protein